MSTFKNYRGEFRKTNTALASIATLAFATSIVSLVAISMPYWNIPAPATFAILAANPFIMTGLAVLAASFFLLGCAIIYGISRNNKISEMKCPKIIVTTDSNLLANGSNIVLCIRQEDYEYIKTNHQNKDDEGEVLAGEYRIDFINSQGERMYITGRNYPLVCYGNNVYLEINSVAVENKLIDSKGDRLTKLGLGTGTNDITELNITFLPSSKVATPKAEERVKQTVLNN
ncbi:hypothetical protein [Wolbachia endosymbiont of Folsomia candida]|uniref:hypothetical protein n=1 Tax=Wolbachia endosymbiont of Folsomia candida TaxID=169402 RepID=UPI000B608982|nr:hypothetical protein [Wolbachia endosymbiont of Folsomia candida]APR98108.1 hypothetical protein ASM33_02210 [Wolbachia endosymbiont of Folsomia candida]